MVFSIPYFGGVLDRRGFFRYGRGAHGVRGFGVTIMDHIITRNMGTCLMRRHDGLRRVAGAGASTGSATAGIGVMSAGVGSAAGASTGSATAGVGAMSAGVGFRSGIKQRSYNRKGS